MLENCTWEERNAVIGFSVAEGVKACEIHVRMLKTSGIIV